MDQTRLREDEIIEELYYNGMIITRCENKDLAEQKEEELNNHYYQLDFLGEILEQHTILLSKKDSSYNDVKNEGVTILKLKPKYKKLI